MCTWLHMLLLGGGSNASRRGTRSARSMPLQAVGLCVRAVTLIRGCMGRRGLKPSPLERMFGSAILVLFAQGAAVQGRVCCTGRAAVTHHRRADSARFRLSDRPSVPGERPGHAGRR